MGIDTTDQKEGEAQRESIKQVLKFCVENCLQIFRDYYKFATERQEDVRDYLQTFDDQLISLSKDQLVSRMMSEVLIKTEGRIMEELWEKFSDTFLEIYERALNVERLKIPQESTDAVDFFVDMIKMRGLALVFQDFQTKTLKEDFERMFVESVAQVYLGQGLSVPPFVKQIVSEEKLRNMRKALDKKSSAPGNRVSDSLRIEIENAVTKDPKMERVHPRFVQRNIDVSLENQRQSSLRFSQETVKEPLDRVIRQFPDPRLLLKRILGLTNDGRLPVSLH